MCGPDFYIYNFVFRTRRLNSDPLKNPYAPKPKPEEEEKYQQEYVKY